MQTLELNTQEAPTKWYAAQDARMRNAANKSHYTESVQIQVERMKMVLGMVYAAKGIYEAFGKKGVSVKVDGARVKDQKNLTALEGDWTALGFTKKITPQGVIYRLTA
jgi:hypothetical protein